MGHIVHLVIVIVTIAIALNNVLLGMYGNPSTSTNNEIRFTKICNCNDTLYNTSNNRSSPSNNTFADNSTRKSEGNDASKIIRIECERSLSSSSLSSSSEKSEFHGNNEGGYGLVVVNPSTLSGGVRRRNHNRRRGYLTRNPDGSCNWTRV